MIIVSQDKRKIVNFDNIYYIDYYKIDETYEIDANIDKDKDSISLGYYKTEERAKEVLQEITKAYKGKNLLQLNGIYSNENIQEINDRNNNEMVFCDSRAKIMRLSNTVFEMPED